jgi:hypothetical protein
MQRTSMRINCDGEGWRGDIERKNNGEAHEVCHIKMPYGNKGTDTFLAARDCFMECWQLVRTYYLSFKRTKSNIP